ncbi:MAG: hypothetical protein EB059_01080 [Alphaproteobacteria bacterium]|nr:hypothetical protein [Alphaproteobacteria bacterium]
MAALLSLSAPAWAHSDASDLQSLKADLVKMQNRINQLEQAQQQQAHQQHVHQQQAQQQQTPSAATNPVTPVSGVQFNDNMFNPSVSAIFNGHFGAFSNKNPAIAGFGTGEEGGRINDGLSLDESELSIASNVDDKFTAQLTAALSGDGIELEEAYVKSLGLPSGLGFKAGRFFQPIGYINDHHTHSDDFADRALPNRIFLNNGYRDDGAMASWILPTETYAEIGGSLLRGADFPVGRIDQSKPGAWVAYGRVGGDIGTNHNWLASLSTLQSRPDERKSNDDNLIFRGDSDLYAASLRYAWSPNGNNAQKEVTMQAEYFLRDEHGTYESVDNATGAIAYNGYQTGWYAQGLYKFHQQWRIGARYSELDPRNTPSELAGTVLDSSGHKPWNAAFMADWTNSEFSRIRLQYGYEEPAANTRDHQVMLQYIMGIGAHRAHAF